MADLAAAARRMSHATGAEIKRLSLSKKLISRGAAQLRRGCMPSIATWECAGDKTNLKTMFAIKETI